MLHEQISSLGKHSARFLTVSKRGAGRQEGRSLHSWEQVIRHSALPLKLASSSYDEKSVHVKTFGTSVTTVMLRTIREAAVQARQQ